MILINILTILTLIMFITYIYFDIKNLYTTKFFFIVFWMLYTFSVPIDLLFKFDLKQVEYLIDLTDENNFIYIEKLLFMGISALIAFIFGYSIVGLYKTEKNVSLKKLVLIPNLYFVLVINLIVIFLFIILFLGIDRQELFLLVNSNIFFKIFFILMLFLKALNLIYIVNTNKFSLLVFFIILVLPILQGNRIDLIIYLVAFLFVKKINFTFLKFMSLFLLGIVLMYFWKIFYSFLFYDLESLILLSTHKYGISSIEFLPSFAIAIEYLKSFEYGYLGESYLNIIYEILPKIIFELNYDSLTSDFTETYAPIAYAKGGSLAFSFYAESWYNFGYLGPFIISFFIGLISRYIDIKNNILLSTIFVFFIIRLWRTEFSLLFKQVFLMVFTLSIVYLLYWIKSKIIISVRNK